MKTTMFVVVLATGFVGEVHDPCRLLTRAEIVSALGSAPSSGKSMGPSLDSETGAQVSVCTRSVGQSTLSIAVAEFPTPADATSAMTAMAAQESDAAENATVSAQPGLGEQAIWRATHDGAIWIALRGKYLLNLTLAGDVGDGERYRSSLKRLAFLALDKL